MSVRKDIEAYDTKLMAFRIKTPLDLFSQVENEYKKTQQDFCEVVMHFIIMSKKTTLQDVERFRKRCARHCKLRDFAPMLVTKVKIGSFIVSFMIPGLYVNTGTKHSERHSSRF